MNRSLPFIYWETLDLLRRYVPAARLSLCRSFLCEDSMRNSNNNNLHKRTAPASHFARSIASENACLVDNNIDGSAR